MVVFASLGVINQIGSYLSPTDIFISAITPVTIAGIILWKTRMAMFGAAIIVASLAAQYWIWRYIFGLFGTFI